MVRVFYFFIMEFCCLNVYCQAISNEQFAKIPNNLRANYYDGTTNELYGCGYTLECSGPHFYITKGYFDSITHYLQLEGYVYIGANTVDTAGMDQMEIFTGRPNKKYLERKIELISTLKNDSSTKNRIIDKKTGRFVLTIKVNDSERLYIDSGQEYFFQEYQINSLLNKKFRKQKYLVFEV